MGALPLQELKVKKVKGEKAALYPDSACLTQPSDSPGHVMDHQLLKHVIVSLANLRLRGAGGGLKCGVGLIDSIVSVIIERVRALTSTANDKWGN
jgi:hypothetical protein